MPMNETMRSTPVTRDRSKRNSLITVTPSSAAPVNHSARLTRRVANTITPKASTVQNIDRDAWTSIESPRSSSVYGICAQWCSVRSSTALAQMNSVAPTA